MNCGEIAKLAPLYLSGEIDASRAAAMDAHLQKCPACLGELKQRACSDAGLRERVHPEAAESTRIARSEHHPVAGDADVQAHERLLLQMHGRWLAAAVGAAATLLLVGLGYEGLLGPQVARVYADAAQDHQREIVEKHPRSWLVDPSQIAALAEQGRIPSHAVGTLAPDGYHLGRARLCWLDGRVFLHLVYTNGAQEISLFLRRRGTAVLPGLASGTAGRRPFHKSDLKKEHVASFQSDQLTAVVVTDQSGDAAMNFARLASAAL